MLHSFQLFPFLLQFYQYNHIGRRKNKCFFFYFCSKIFNQKVIFQTSQKKKICFFFKRYFFSSVQFFATLWQRNTGYFFLWEKINGEHKKLGNMIGNFEVRGYWLRKLTVKGKMENRMTALSFCYFQWSVAVENVIRWKMEVFLFCCSVHYLRQTIWRLLGGRI